MKYKSHAVIAKRIEPKDSLDDFPTPRWATRALIHEWFGPDANLTDLTCLEPACGVGNMSKVLKHYFAEVHSYDIHAYGFGQVRDFLSYPYEPESYDSVITNPPFRLAEQFIVRALPIARRGVLVIVRTVFLEGVGRLTRLFRPRPPSAILQFSERVPMLKGRLDKSATTATAYAGLVWEKQCKREAPYVLWVPPSRRQLERDSDYE
jgi:hypothetical protein